MIKKNNDSYPLIIGLIAIILWATPPIVSIYLKQTIDFYKLTFFIHIIAITFLGLSIYMFSKKQFFPNIRIISFRAYIYFALSGVSQAITYLAFHYAIQNAPPIEATIIHSIWPLFLLLFSVFLDLNRDKISLYQIFLIFLAFFGSVIIMTRNINIFTLNIYDPLILFAFLSAIFASLNSIFYKLSQKHINFSGKDNLNHHIHFLFFRILFGIIFLLLLLPFIDISFNLTINEFIWILYLGCFTYVGAHIAFSYALFNLKTINLATLSYLTPLISIILIYFVFSEKLNLYTLLGGFLVFIANYLLQKENK